MPHWRYVAVQFEGTPIGRRALQNALTGMARKNEVPDDRLPNVTRFEWPHAIIRFRHMDVDSGRLWMPEMKFAIHGGDKVPLSVTTLRTSGTIKTLTDNLGILQKR